MPRTKWFLFLYSIVLILIAINLSVNVPFIFQPFAVAISTLAPVLIIGGVLYYILRPLVYLLKKFIPKAISILLIFTAFAGVMTILITFVGPVFISQVNQLIENVPGFINDIEDWLSDLTENEWVQMIRNEGLFEDIDPGAITDNFSNVLTNIGSNLLAFFGFIFSVATVVVIMPFVLFFLLKDGYKLPDNILKFLPKDQKEEGEHILHDMDETLSSYIQGQAIVSLCVGLLTLIAYFIIGLDYPLILALVAMFTNLIPFIGPFIGTIPALFVALFESLLTALWVTIAIVVIQQIESNLISPNVMGKKLSIHPLTIILLLLLAGNLAGVIGLILAIPFYAVTKVIVQNIYRLLKLRYPNIN